MGLRTSTIVSNYHYFDSLLLQVHLSGTITSIKSVEIIYNHIVSRHVIKPKHIRILTFMYIFVVDSNNMILKVHYYLLNSIGDSFPRPESELSHCVSAVTEARPAGDVTWAPVDVTWAELITATGALKQSR